MFYKIGQKSHQTFGILLKEICRKKLPKIAQSGHTGLSGVYMCICVYCLCVIPLIGIRGCVDLKFFLDGTERVKTAEMK